MRKIFVIVLVGLMLFATVAPSYAGDNPSKVCKEHNDFGLSHGACVSYNTSGEGPAADAVSWCKLNNNYVAWGFRNLGQCINAIK